MGWEPDFVEDGDSATAAATNALLDSAESWVNDIERAGIKRGAFNHFFPPVTGLLPATGTYTVDENLTIQNYLESTFAPSMTYTTFGADGGSDSTGVYTGDRSILGHPDSGSLNPGMLTLPGSGFRVGMDNGDRVGAILVMLNAELKDYVKGGTPTVLYVMFCLQFRLNGAGTWFTIDSSERFVDCLARKIDSADVTEDVAIDCPIACLITEAMVEAVGTAASDLVSHIRAMTSIYRVGGTSATTVNIYHWNLTALPLHAQYTAV